MKLFQKKIEQKTYDREHETPVIRCSICTGEETAGFQNIDTGHFREVMLIRNEKDLEEFKRTYGIAKIRKAY